MCDKFLYGFSRARKRAASGPQEIAEAAARKVQ